MTESTLLPGLRVVGLLGGVGSGKSTVARALEAGLAERARTLLHDSDEAVGRLLAEPAILDQIEAALGGPVRNEAGQLDRAALAARVFDDEGARKHLEGILHPAVRQEIHRELTALEATGAPAWAVLDVPLLLENGLDAICDALVYVDTPAEAREARARARSGWSAEEWRAREAAQRPVAEKRAAADVIVENLGTDAPTIGDLSDPLEKILRLPPRSLTERWPQWDRLPPSRFPRASEPADD